MSCYGNQHVWVWEGTTTGTWPYRGQRCKCGAFQWPPPSEPHEAKKGAA